MGKKEESSAEMMCFIIVLLLRLLQCGIWRIILVFYLKVGTKRVCVKHIRRKMKMKRGFNYFFFWLFLHPVVQIWPLSECLVTQQLWGVGSFLFPHLQDCRELCCLCYPVELHNTCFVMQFGEENRQAFRHWFKTFLGIFTTYEVDLRYSDPFLIL